MRVRKRSAELAAGGWFGPVQGEAFLDEVADVVRRQPGDAVMDNYATVLYTAQPAIHIST
jgi:hypothetical protein